MKQEHEIYGDSFQKEICILFVENKKYTRVSGKFSVWTTSQKSDQMIKHFFLFQIPT